MPIRVGEGGGGGGWGGVGGARTTPCGRGGQLALAACYRETMDQRDEAAPRRTWGLGHAQSAGAGPRLW
jgi:hypothetical protein